MADFERVWAAIQQHAGEEFRQVQGNPFRYVVPGSYVRPDRVNQNLPKEYFRRALERAPFASTSVLQDLRGPSYLYAILMDNRIRPAWDTSARAAVPSVPEQRSAAQSPSGLLRPMTRGELTMSGLNFVTVDDLEPTRGPTGEIVEFMPQERFAGAATTLLNRYGSGPFCRFNIPANWAGAAGVYLIRVDGAVRYVGECVDLARRFNLGYGAIQPINCFVGGQPTNCKVNNLVLQSAQAGRTPELWFTPSVDRKAVEARLLRELRPTWNSRGL